MTDPLPTTRPQRRSGLTLEQQNDGFVITDAAGARLSELNHTAAAVWQVCDGRATVAEIITAATQLFDAPEQVLAADVVAILDRFQHQGLLEPFPPST